MKTRYYIILLMCFTACSGSDGQENTGQKVKESAQESAPEVAGDRGQDYSQLFIRDAKDCELMSTAEIAEVVGIDPENVTFFNQSYGYCGYELKLNDRSKTSLTFHPMPASKKDIQSEIKSFQEIEKDFGPDNMQGIIKMSQTGDTYFCIRSARGTLMMYNPSYDGALEILFGAAIESQKVGGLSDEQKQERMDNAIKVADYLLQHYKD